MIFTISACQHGSNVLQTDGNPDTGGACPVQPWVFPETGSEPAWVTHSCPATGCPNGTFCMRAGEAAAIVDLGCAPIPAACSGALPSCSCMGCVCSGSAICDMNTGQMVCATPTASTRAVKKDIVYVSRDEREDLAREALAIPLAHYHYNDEAEDARLRLGFIIEDQPDPSPAVLEDRRHVDQYGYTSMLLATVQQQAQEIAELRARLDALEHVTSKAARRR